MFEDIEAEEAIQPVCRGVHCTPVQKKRERGMDQQQPTLYKAVARYVINIPPMNVVIALAMTNHSFYATKRLIVLAS